jgi:hypothetical protein
LLETTLRPSARRDLIDLVVGAFDGLRILDRVAGDHVDVASLSVGGDDGVTRGVLLPLEERQQIGKRTDGDAVFDGSRQVTAECERAALDERNEPVTLLLGVGDQVVEQLQAALVGTFLDRLFP